MSKQNKPTGFFDLPFEIREMIFLYLFGQDANTFQGMPCICHCRTRTRAAGPTFITSLLLTNRQIFAELHSTMIKHAIFVQKIVPVEKRGSSKPLRTLHEQILPAERCGLSQFRFIVLEIEDGRSSEERWIFDREDSGPSYKLKPDLIAFRMQFEEVIDIISDAAQQENPAYSGAKGLIITTEGTGAIPYEHGTLRNFLMDSCFEMAGRARRRVSQGQLDINIFARNRSYITDTDPEEAESAAALVALSKAELANKCASLEINIDWVVY